MTKKKTKIVIASVLKPVDDVRNYEKIGCTLSKMGHYQVIICGTKSDQKVENNAIEFHVWHPFRRLSFTRFITQFAFIKALWRHKPQVVVITTHELLLTAVLFKLPLSYKLIYDVQEDYYRNLNYQHFYPTLIRLSAACMIRALEWLSRPFINHYFLAEAMYQSDLKFTRGKATLIDNKSLPLNNSPRQDTCKFIFTGTITDYSQALESVKLYLKVKVHFKHPNLTVIGHCPSLSYRTALNELAKSDPSIDLQLSDHPIPHSLIVEQIQRANLGIIGYDPNPINQYKVPTKLYEYTAARLPYLVRIDTYWSQLGLTFGGAIPVNFEHPNGEEMAKKLESLAKSMIQSDEAEWSNNETILIEVLNKILFK